MKNRYEVRGDMTVIFVPASDGQILETLISTSKLAKAQELGTTWRAIWTKGVRGYYVRGYFNGHSRYGDRSVRLHRHLMNIDDEHEIDHMNRNTLDNTDGNLRIVTRQENQQNKGLPRNNTTGFKNVRKTRSGRFDVKVSLNNECYMLGLYDTKEEANRVAQQFRLRYYSYSSDDVGLEILPEYDFLNDLSRIKQITKGGSSRYYGVSRECGHWAARYSIDGRSMFVGYFMSEVDAACAHDTYVRLHEITNSHINFPNTHLTVDEVKSRKYNRGGTSSKYLGVTLRSNGKWRSQYFDGMSTHALGTFDHEVSAAIAHDIAIFKTFGPSATKKFNFPDIFNTSTVTWSDVSNSPIDMVV